MCDELREGEIESLPLPKDWAESVRHAVLNVVGIVRLAMLSGRELLIQEGDAAQAQIHRLEWGLAPSRSGFFRCFGFADGACPLFRRVNSAPPWKKGTGTERPRFSPNSGRYLLGPVPIFHYPLTV